MKLTTIATAFLLLAMAVVSLGLYGLGYGEVVAVTNTHQRVDGFTANTVSLYNKGTNTVFALANCTTNQLGTRMAAGTAVPIASGVTYTFDARQQDHIFAVCMATTNAAGSEVHLGAY